jgi:hypothetical protein
MNSRRFIDRMAFAVPREEIDDSMADYPSAYHRRPLSRGSNPCGYPHEPLVSYRINRQLSGWILPALMIRAFGVHCQEPTFISHIPRNSFERRRPQYVWHAICGIGAADLVPTKAPLLIASAECSETGPRPLVDPSALRARRAKDSVRFHECLLVSPVVQRARERGSGFVARAPMERIVYGVFKRS